MSSSIFRGTVHGKTIELEEAPGLPDGQAVTVLVQPVPAQEALPPGDGLRRSFGAWSEDAEELAKFLEWNRQQRQESRPGIAE